MTGSKSPHLQINLNYFLSCGTNLIELYRFLRTSHGYPKKEISLLFLTLMFFLYPQFALHAEDKIEQAASKSTKTMAESKIGLLQSQLVRLNARLEEIEEIRDHVSELIERNKLKIYDTKKWSETAHTAQSLLSSENITVRQLNNFWDTFNNSIEPVTLSIYTPVERLWRLYRTAESNSTQKRALRRVYDELNDVLTKARNSLVNENLVWKNILRRSFSLRNIRYRGIEKNNSSYKDLLTLAISILSKKTGSEFDFILRAKNIAFDITTAKDNYFKRERNRLKTNMEKIESQIKKQAEVLGKFEETKRLKTQIDNNLVYAVYGMIFALVILFLGLRIFSNDVAKELIRRRSLVEVIGMAFMLITIIILGTGGKLTKEVLGTLLGTIAGYIFARSVQRRGDDGDQKPRDGNGR